MFSNAFTCPRAARLSLVLHFLTRRSIFPSVSSEFRVGCALRMTIVSSTTWRALPSFLLSPKLAAGVMGCFKGASDITASLISIYVWFLDAVAVIFQRFVTKSTSTLRTRILWISVITLQADSPKQARYTANSSNVSRLISLNLLPGLWETLQGSDLVFFINDQLLQSYLTASSRLWGEHLGYSWVSDNT